MSALAAIHNSTIAITADAPCILVVVTGVVPGGAQSKLTVDSAKVLMQSDLNTWAGTYTSAYTTATYTTPGTVVGTGASSVSSLSTKLTVDGTVIVTKNTTFQLDLSVTVPAQSPAPAPDPTTTYSAQCSFTSVIQTKLKTA